MKNLIAQNLIFPLGDSKKILLGFKESGRCDDKDWGMHLGVDMAAPAETKVFAIGNGIVAYSKMHTGEFSESGEILKRNWGGVVIIMHKDIRTDEIFYSLYGHLGKRYAKKGDRVLMGEYIGDVGKSMTESNGIWKEEHLHFSIYKGPFNFKVLPGYYREEDGLTQPEYWLDPVEFIKKYNKKILS